MSAYDMNDAESYYEGRFELPELPQVDTQGLTDMLGLPQDAAGDVVPDDVDGAGLCTFCAQNPCACEQIEMEIDAAREREQAEFDSHLDASYEARTDLGDL